MKSSKAVFFRILSVVLVLATLVITIPITAPRSNAVTINQNQANMVARCDYMYNATWVSQKTITSWKSGSYFTEGNTYRIPYAWPVTAGKWVGETSYGISVETFLSATRDASSVFYTKQSYYSGNTGSYAPYYGNDCSTYVSYCWGLSARQTTSSIVNVSTLIGNTTTANVNAYLKVGDALNHSGSHVVFVSDIVYNAAGAITSIEITEQTPPQLKRTNHTVASLVSKYGASYKIYRYNGTVSAPPSGAGTVTGSTNPDSYTVPTTALTTGSSGTGVSWIQAVLVQLGYSITVDGAYGSGTATAVATFQQNYGLTVSGTADTATIAKLQSLWANKYGFYITTASNLNMRSGDGTSYGIITTIPQNSSVAVVGFNAAGSWANIIYNGTEGWVSKSYLSFVRKFNYAVNYITNTSATVSPVSFKHDQVITVSAAPANGENVFRGWQLLRASDWVWYNGSSWVSAQGSAKLYQPGEKITFSQSMFNSKTADDLFYLCAVWGTATAPTISTVTSSEVSPSKYGWKWPSGEAYGYMGNYGGNGQDIELCVDLCLLPSSETSSAAFYANGTDSRIVIDPSSVTLGSTSVSYDWGELSLNNWRDVKFKLINNYAYVFIDGELIASGSGFAANESYQLLFSLTGEMAVDNAMLYRSDGHCFFNIDFENATDAQKVMGEGLGSRTLLFPDTSDFTVSISPSSSAIKGTGDVTYVATPSAGEGHTYSWSSSNSALNSYMRTSGNTCTIDIPAELAGALSSTITCTVTSNGGVTNSASATLTYAPNPAPILSSITPSASSITGTGSATYTAAASGDGLTYNWSSSNSALNAYLSGVNTNKLTVNIPTELSSALSATITCTVTNSYGKTATKTATFSYTPAPAPTISAVTPSSASLTDSGTVTYKVTAEGEGLTYSWTCSDSSLNAYVTGADTDTVTISIPDKLSGAITAAFTCTVTNSYGKTAQSDPAILVYTVSEDTGDISVIILGDANGDGEVKTADSLIAKRIAAGIDTPTPEQEKALDVNGDGKINSADTNLISRFIAGIIIEF